MNRMLPRHRSLSCAVACVALVACGATGDEDGTAVREDAHAAALRDVVAAADSTYEPETGRETLPSDRIYHTLTDHEWYRRGEPLLHDGLAYQPAGSPLSASASVMEQVGTYDGVDYYRNREDTAGLLYIPVFVGYWQAFRAQPQPGRGD